MPDISILYSFKGEDSDGDFEYFAYSVHPESAVFGRHSISFASQTQIYSIYNTHTHTQKIKTKNNHEYTTHILMHIKYSETKTKCFLTGLLFAYSSSSSSIATAACISLCRIIPYVLC